MPDPARCVRHFHSFVVQLSSTIADDCYALTFEPIVSSPVARCRICQSANRFDVFFNILIELIIEVVVVWK